MSIIRANIFAFTQYNSKSSTEENLGVLLPLLVKAKYLRQIHTYVVVPKTTKSKSSGKMYGEQFLRKKKTTEVLNVVVRLSPAKLIGCHKRLTGA